MSKNELDLESMQMSCILPPHLQKRALHIRLSALHIFSDKQLVEATWLIAREQVFSRIYGSQIHWKWDERAQCYSDHAVLTCHQWTEPRDRGAERVSRYERRKLISQVQRPQRPQQLRCCEKMKTRMFSLTSKHKAQDCFRDIVDDTAARARRKWRTA